MLMSLYHCIGSSFPLICKCSDWRSSDPFLWLKSCFTIEEESVEFPLLLVFRCSKKVSSGGCCGRDHKWVRIAFLWDSQLSGSAFHLNGEIKRGGICGFALTPLDWNPWVDIELHKQFSVLTSQTLRELGAGLLQLSLQLIFVLF